MKESFENEEKMYVDTFFPPQSLFSMGRPREIGKSGAQGF